MNGGINIPIECINELNISQEKKKETNSVRNLIPNQTYSIQFLVMLILFLSPRRMKQELPDNLQLFIISFSKVKKK